MDESGREPSTAGDDGGEDVEEIEENGRKKAKTSKSKKRKMEKERERRALNNEGNEERSRGVPLNESREEYRSKSRADHLKRYLEVDQESFIKMNPHRKVEVGWKLRELLHTVADGAFVPLLHSITEEFDVRKLCSLKGILTHELSSSQLKEEDVKKEEPKEEPEDAPSEGLDDSDIDGKMAEANADIVADISLNPF